MGPSEALSRLVRCTSRMWGTIGPFPRSRFIDDSGRRRDCVAGERQRGRAGPTFIFDIARPRPMVADERTRRRDSRYVRCLTDPSRPPLLLFVTPPTEGRTPGGLVEDGTPRLPPCWPGRRGRGGGTLAKGRCH